jgi:hypothetical protein
MQPVAADGLVFVTSGFRDPVLATNTLRIRHWPSSTPWPRPMDDWPSRDC